MKLSRMKDVIYIAEKRTLKYAGRIVRSKNERWARKSQNGFLCDFLERKVDQH